jgi:hypothetical protein
MDKTGPKPLALTHERCLAVLKQIVGAIEKEWYVTLAGIEATGDGTVEKADDVDAWLIRECLIGQARAIMRIADAAGVTLRNVPEFLKEE